MLAEKVRLLLLPKLLPRKDKPILKALQSQPRTRPKPRNKANQNHCEPKRKPKNFEADFSDSITPNRNFADEMKADKTKSRELENLLAEKILTKYFTLESTTAKKGFEFLR